MKTPVTATIASLLYSAATFAEPLSEPDQAYIVLGLAAVRVMTECAGYEAVRDSMRKLADQIGVDPAVVRAVGQVLLMDSGQDYESSWLIPEVTRLMNDTDDGLSREQNQSNRGFCKRWGDALVEKGLIQKKVDGR
jgi:hypothetical protein